MNNSNSVDRDLVLFLGAGFSRDANLPLMSEFGKLATSKHFSLAALPRRMTPELTAAARTYEAFRQALIDSGALNENDADNIETVFCIAEALREAGLTSMLIDGSEVDLNTIVDKIRFWIWKVYHQLPFYNPRRQADIEIYKSFMEQLSSSGIAERITVLTTNYDIVFEWVAQISGFLCSYPISSARNLCVGGGTKQFAALKQTNRQTIPILKLHGSINYFRRPEQRNSLLIATNVSDGSKIAGRNFREGVPAVVAVDALADIRSATGFGDITPAIVPPGYAKLVSEKWLRETWAISLKVLQNASAILFIGYSIPPSDGLLRSILIGALGTRKFNERHPKIFAINLDPQVYERLRQIYGSIVQPFQPMDLRKALDGELEQIFSAMGT